MRLVAARTVLVAGVVAILMVAISTFAPTVEAHSLAGSIKTTDLAGNSINENVGYSSRCEVAINGGPHQTQANHLPDGTYDVGVTDPSGHTVLGEGHGTVTIESGNGTFGPFSLCTLVTPVPYKTTPNNGDEYKVWLCHQGELFINSHCKKDNFKVREVEGPHPPVPPGQPPGQPPTSPPIPPGIGEPPAQGPGPGQPPGAEPPTLLPPVLKLPAAGISGYVEEEGTNYGNLLWSLLFVVPSSMAFGLRAQLLRSKRLQR